MPEYGTQTEAERRQALEVGAARQRPSFEAKPAEHEPHRFPGGFGESYRYLSSCSWGCGSRVEGDALIVPVGVDPGQCPNAPLKPIHAPAKPGRVFVRGRFTATGRRFDVLKVEGERVELYARDCVWPEEAMELAVACLRGRLSFALGGRRSLLAPTRSGLLVAESQVATLAGRDGLRFERAGADLLEVKDG